MLERVHYPEGDVPSSDPCLSITCEAGDLVVLPVKCPEQERPMYWVCADPVKTPNQCCLSCPSQGK